VPFSSLGIPLKLTINNWVIRLAVQKPDKLLNFEKNLDAQMGAKKRMCLGEPSSRCMKTI